jgi:CHAD domain-containing protein
MPKSNRIVWDESASAIENARRKLPPLALAYIEEGRKLAHGPVPDEALHRFRLRTKRLRYTLEFFRACYGPGLERRLEMLRQIQDLLGDINDCAVTREVAVRKLPARSAERQAVDGFVRRRAQQKIAQFRRYWQTVVDLPGEDRRWRNYLARVPGSQS